MHYRTTELLRSAVDVKKRTVQVCFSTENPVDRGSYQEILDHSAENVDLSRLNNGHPFLLNHSPDSQIGIIEHARIDPDKKGRALIRFGRSALAEEIFQDIQDGLRPHISVGYERLKTLSSEKRDGQDVIRFKWRPFEISSVPVPADTKAGVARSNQNNMDEEIESVSPTRHERRAAEARMRNIRTATDLMIKDAGHIEGQLRDLSARSMADGSSEEEFHRKALDLMRANPRRGEFYQINEFEETTGEGLGLNNREMASYSITREIQNVIRDGRPSEFAREVSRSIEKKLGRTAEGFMIPSDLRVRVGKRDLTAGVFSQGGATVPTIIQTPIIELLRNRMVTARLGVQQMGGLGGNVAIPRQTAAGTPQALPEIATLLASNQALDQVPLTPHRVGAMGVYSKQLLLQSGIDIENFVRDDLTKVIAIKHDYLTLQGSGSGDEPMGIMSTPGIGSLIFGGAATWSNVIAFETALSLANADVGKMAFVTSPSVRGKWKQVAKIGTTYPVFLWEYKDWGDDSDDGLVNGYRAAVTNQILNNAVVFGQWSDAICALFGGWDIVVDYFTLAANAEVRIVVNTFMDVVCRHPQSFVWSADAGNQ